MDGEKPSFCGAWSAGKSFSLWDQDMMKKTILIGCALLLSPLVQADSLDALDAAFLPENRAAQVGQKSMPLRPKALAVELGSLSVKKQQRIDTLSSTSPEAVAPVQVGLSRDITELHDESRVAEALTWSPTAKGGQVAAISITSPGALALRVGLQVTSLPSSAVLRFYAQQGHEQLEIHATQVLRTLASNLVAGDESVHGRMFWSPPINGDEITLEIELPVDVDRDQLQVSLPILSHLFMDPISGIEKSTAKSIGDAGSCNINYQCEAAQNPSLDLKSRAVAKMGFITQGNAYICTGTMLNNTRWDRAPYFLSANHCISDQTTASTLITYWLYRADACRSSQLDSEATMLTGGAQLLYSNVAQDTSFFRLNDSAPASAAFAGWNTSLGLYNLNQAIMGLHNPAGDLQKVSKGAVVNYARCTDIVCYRSDQGSANAVEVRWGAGVTEGGSSGSGLFSGDYLIAQLYGGTSSCSTSTGHDRYSLFAPAYQSGLKHWLSPSDTPVADGRSVVEFYNPDLNHYFITADAAEQNFVDSGAVGRWLRTGQSFKAGGSVAACRFYGNTAANPATGSIYGPNSHFYTVDQEGCNQLISIFNPNTPSWKFESYDFFSTPPDSNGNCPAGALAVHRLYNNGFAKGKASNHRFITDTSLVAPMIKEGWLYEGVDMCAPL